MKCPGSYCRHGHYQPWYWLCRVGDTCTCRWNNVNHPRHQDIGVSRSGRKRTPLHSLKDYDTQMFEVYDSKHFMAAIEISGLNMYLFMYRIIMVKWFFTYTSHHSSMHWNCTGWGNHPSWGMRTYKCPTWNSMAVSNITIQRWKEPAY